MQKTNRDYSLKTADLSDAKANAAKECKVLGDRCKGWQARVDSLTAALAKIDVRSSDPRADAIADLLHLIANVEKATHESNRHRARPAGIAAVPRDRVDTVLRRGFPEAQGKQGQGN